MEKEIKAENLMTAAKYATTQGVDRRTIYNWIKNGLVEKVEYLGKSWIDISTKKEA